MPISVQVNRFRCRHPRCSGSVDTFSLFTAQEHIAQHFSQDCSNKSLKNLHYAYECPVCRIGFVTKFYAVDHYMTKHHNVRQLFENYSQINRDHTDRYLLFSNVYMAAYLEVVLQNKTIEMGSAPMPIQANIGYDNRPRSEPYRPPAPTGTIGYQNDPYGTDPYGVDPFGNGSDDFRSPSRNTRSPVRSPAYRSGPPASAFSSMRERTNSGVEQSSMSGEYSNGFMENRRMKSPDGRDNKKSRGRGGPGGGRGNRREPMCVIDSNSRRERNDWSGDPRRGGNKAFGKRPNTDNNSSFYGDQSFNNSYSSAPQSGFNTSKRDRSYSRSRSRSASRSPPRKMNSATAASYSGNDSFMNKNNRGAKTPPRDDRRSYSRSVSRSRSRSPVPQAAPAVNASNNTNSSYADNSNKQSGNGYKTSQNRRGGFGQNRFGNNSMRNDRTTSGPRSPPNSPSRKKNLPFTRQSGPSKSRSRSRSRSFSKSPER
ncbi:unnamed protein product [Auanema sp. JU1783]|nr:unnamed protein product [Auanema sp. JU1783]